MKKFNLLILSFIIIHASISPSFKPENTTIKSSNESYPEDILDIIFEEKTRAEKRITKETKETIKQCTKIEEQWAKALKHYFNDELVECAKILDDHVAYQTLRPKLRYKACLILAQYYHDKKERRAREHLWTILKFAQKSDLTYLIRAKAHGLVGTIYRKKAQKNKQRKRKYNRTAVRHYNKAIRLCNKIIASRTNDENLTDLLEDKFDCMFEVAKYHQNSFCDQYENEETDRLRKKTDLAIKFYTEIIDYQYPKKSRSIMNCYVFSLINLAVLYLHPMIKNFEKSNELLRKTIYFTSENFDTLKDVEGEETTRKLISDSYRYLNALKSQESPQDRED